MALSREEATNIGKETADKVIKSVQACRCGLAMWDASATSEFFAGIIDVQQPALLQPLPQLMEDVLSIVEQDCGVDMSRPKELSQHLEADIKKRDWGEARVNFALLRGSILDPLQQCATEGSNPGGQYVTIADPGKTTFKSGEVISKDTFDKENERVRKLGEKPAAVIPTESELTPATIDLLTNTEGNPIRKFCCRQCGECASSELLEEDRFPDRIAWLRSHYKTKHPGIWGKF